MDKMEKQMLPPQNEEFDDWREPKSKVKTLIIILIILIIFEILFYFAYFYFYHNTSYLLDQNKKTLINLNHEIFKKINIDDSLDTQQDLNVQGTLELKNDSDIYSLALDFTNSPKNFIMALALGLKQNDKDIFSGKAQIQDNNLYLDSKDLYNGILKIPFNFNSNEEENEEIDFDIALLANPKDLEYLITKLVEYHFEALKEGNLSVRIAGLNKKEYILELGASEVINASKVLKKAIEKDEELSKIIRVYKIKNYNFIPTGKIKIVANTLSDQLISMDIATNMVTATFQYKNGKYLIETPTATYYEWYNDNIFKLEEYENDLLIGSVEYNFKEQSLVSTVYYEKDTISLYLQNKDNKNIFNLNYNGSDNESYSLNLDISKNKIMGNLKLIDSQESLEIVIDLDVKRGENLINIIDEASSKDIDALSEDDLNKIINNIDKIIENFNFEEEREKIA